MSRYNKDDRFVIEISGVFEGGQDSPYNFYRIKGLDNFILFARDLDKLQRITDFGGKMYTGDELEDERAASYNEGMEDAWDAARKIILPINFFGFSGALSEDDLCNIFGSPNSYGILNEFSALEATKKISDYEERKEKMFCTGDVIQNKEQPEIIAVVTFADSDGHFDAIKLSESDEYGKKYGVYYKRDVSFWEKTGQHYNLDEIFRPMQVEGDE